MFFTDVIEKKSTKHSSAHFFTESKAACCRTKGPGLSSTVDSFVEKVKDQETPLNAWNSLRYWNSVDVSEPYDRSLAHITVWKHTCKLTTTRYSLNVPKVPLNLNQSITLLCCKLCIPPTWRAFIILKMTSVSPRVHWRSWGVRGRNPVPVCHSQSWIKCGKRPGR